MASAFLQVDLSIEQSHVGLQLEGRGRQCTVRTSRTTNRYLVIKAHVPISFMVSQLLLCMLNNEYCELSTFTDIPL